VGGRHGGLRRHRPAGRPGSSPSVAGLAGGGYVVAFHLQGSGLWTYGSRGTRGLALPLKDGTSPSIAGLVGRGYEIAFQNPRGGLTTTGAAGTRRPGLGLNPATSPSIAAGQAVGRWDERCAGACSPAARCCC